jgi:vitamin B12 transporter
MDRALLAAYSLQSLSELLAQQTPAFIKSMGTNGFATLNIRGASGAQSSVFWNGIPINNAAYGFADISNMNVNQFDDVKVLYGSSSAMLGSGNMGATILLDDPVMFSDSIVSSKSKIGVALGSYSNYRLHFDQRIYGKKIFFKIKTLWHSVENNFLYFDQNLLEKKMENAQANGWSSTATFGYKFNEKSIFKLNLWLQNSNRALPPALFETYSVKHQKDQTIRLVGDYTKKINSGFLFAKSSFSNDRMQYDSAVVMFNKFQTIQSFSEIGYKFLFKNADEWTVSIPVHLNWLKNTNLVDQSRYQHRVALSSQYSKYINEHILLNLQVRLEKINQDIIPLGGANAQYKLADWFTLKGNFQRSYRAPTLNEWYYNPGGNINLKPEKSWHGEMGYQLDAKISSNLKFQQSLIWFHRAVKDWIYWMGGAIWTPHNIASVYSRGVETFNSLQWQSGKWRVQLCVNTSYVRATTLSSYMPQDGSLGKQIPYTPIYNGQVSSMLSYKRVQIVYTHTYTGYRYATTDESQYLTPYNLQYIKCVLPIKINKVDVQWGLQINNLTDKNYQVIFQRPMPRRNASLNLQISF